jgi:site-specific DNA-methyltransferase (cytosine-N4-specific)
MNQWLNRCHFGDVRDVLRQMIAAGVKVNTIVTSPPYWGLRSYLPDGHTDKVREIGSEPTLREFIETMTEVMMLAREVLADDGTLWMNMGDCYATGAGKVNTAPGGGIQGERWAGGRGDDKRPKMGPITQPNRMPQPGLKPKDLAGQPWRLAFALQDAGWWLRSDIIWAKPNPMPESTRDRPTKAHEYLFLLAKSERYYFDFEAWKEPVTGGAHARRPSNGVGFGHGYDENPKPRQTYKTPDGWDTSKGEGGHGAFHKEGREKGRKLADAGSGTKNNTSFDAAMAVMPDDRNRRSVWTVPTEAFKGAHFATFPQKLIEPCILAGAPVGGVVLDIFMGSGTTAQVAERLGRQWIGIDIDIRNKALQDGRLRQTSLMLEAADA